MFLESKIFHLIAEKYVVVIPYQSKSQSHYKYCWASDLNPEMFVKLPKSWLHYTRIRRGSCILLCLLFWDSEIDLPPNVDGTQSFGRTTLILLCSVIIFFFGFLDITIFAEEFHPLFLCIKTKKKTTFKNYLEIKVESGDGFRLWSTGDQSPAPVSIHGGENQLMKTGWNYQLDQY